MTKARDELDLSHALTSMLGLPPPPWQTSASCRLACSASIRLCWCCTTQQLQQGGRQADHSLDTLLPGVLSDDPILGQGCLNRVRLLFFFLSSLRRGAMMSHTDGGAGDGVAQGLWLVCSTFSFFAKSSLDEQFQGVVSARACSSDLRQSQRGGIGARQMLAAAN